MFVHSKTNWLLKNFGVLTRSFTSEKFGTSPINNHSRRSRPISLFLGAGCGLLAALFYLKKEDFENFVEENKILAVASCLDTETKTDNNAKQINSGSIKNKADISKELGEALKRTDQKLLVFKEKHGIPGISATVSVDGRTIWSKGYGYSDVENLVQCTPSTVMRIASISKPLTASAIALLWQRGKLDIDLPIQTYVPEFLVKQYEGKEVVITTRQILTHMSGIRNYIKAEHFEKGNSKSEIDKLIEEEWHNKSHFSDTLSSLKLFKEDDLIHAPNTRHLYSTLSWTLLMASIETTTKESYLSFMHSDVFLPYKLYNTQEDLNDPILPHRSKYYERKSNILTNTPYVDNSYKWAGGGFLSDVLDLSRFANTMLGFYQGVYPPTGGKYVLSRGTLKEMWSCQTKTREDGYCMGLGWFIKPSLDPLKLGQKDEIGRFSVSHSGGAVGASSHLLILPRGEECIHEGGSGVPSGIVIAIIGNLEKISFKKLLSEIGEDVYSAAYD